MHFLKTAAIAIFCIFLAACGDEHALNQKIDSLVEKVDAAREELKDQRNGAESSADSLISKRHELFQARADRDYNEVAKSGAAGTTEALILTKKMMDNPSYGSDSASQISRLEREIERIESLAIRRQEYIEQARADLARAKEELAGARTELRQLRSQ